MIKPYAFIYFLALFVQLTFSGSVTGQSSKKEPTDLTFVTSSSVAVYNGGLFVNFYIYDQTMGWRASTVSTLYLGESVNQVLFIPFNNEILMLIRRNNEVTFNKIDAQKGSISSTIDSLKFISPRPIDEMAITSGGFLVIRSGGALNVYGYQNKQWIHVEQYDHQLPEGTNEFVVRGGGLLGIRTGKNVKFYDMSQKYAEVEKAAFESPGNVDELIISEEALGVREGKTVRFYRFTDKWEYVKELDLTVN